MASATAGPITPSDEQIHLRATRVVYKGLALLEEMLDSGVVNCERFNAVATGVNAATEAMLPPADKSDEFLD